MFTKVLVVLIQSRGLQIFPIWTIFCFELGLWRWHSNVWTELSIVSDITDFSITDGEEPSDALTDHRTSEAFIDTKQFQVFLSQEQLTKVAELTSSCLTNQMSSSGLSPRHDDFLPGHRPLG